MTSAKPPSNRSVRGLLRSVKSANTKGAAESRMAVRIATLLTVEVSALATLQQDVGSWWTRFVIPVGLAVAFAFSYVTRHRPGFVVKACLAIGMVVAAAHFVSQLRGIGQNAAAAQRPLAELFLWTQLLHSFDVPSRRDLKFSLVASTVLIGVGGVLSTSTAYGLMLAVWVAAAAAALSLMQRGQLTDDARQALPATAAPLSPSKLRAIGTDFAKLGALLTACGLIVGAVFLVLPAAGTARAFTFPANLPDVERIPGGGLVNRSLGGDGTDATGDANGGPQRASFGFVGFSKELDTGLRGRPDDTVVMRVRAGKPGFWRGQSFDTWDGRTWTASSDKTRVVRGNGVIELPHVDGSVIDEDGDEFVQTIYVDKPGPNLVFGATTATKLYFPDQAVLTLPDGTIRAGVRLEKGAVYTVISRRPVASEAALRTIPFTPLTGTTGLSEALRSAATQVPNDMPTRIRDLAYEITASESSVIGKVRAIERWLGVNTTYSLDIPPLPAGADSLDTFLFEQRVGFCEQIATALVMLLRSVGVPARLGVGYASGDRNPFTGLYEVKASDAHAWTEVYVPSAGWLTFDPTANVPFAEDEATPLARDGLGQFVTARLPGILAVAGRIGLIGSIATAAASLIWGLTALRRRRMIALARTWPDRWNGELDRLAAARHVARSPGQTAHSLADALGLNSPDWDAALATVDQAAFAPNPPSAADRAAADQLLAQTLQHARAKR